MAFWPSRNDFKLAPGADAELAVLVEFADRLTSIIETAKKQDHEFIGSDAIRKLSVNVGIEYSKLETIFNSLENLRAVAQEFGGPKGSLTQITKAVSEDLRGKLESKADLIASAIEAYDEDNPISISFKAQKLTYLRDKLFHEAEIITDARPVFDSKGETILEMVITHSLVITYWTRSGWERIHIAVDAADVLSIRKAADRAVVKGRSLKQALQTKWKTEVLKDAP